MRVLFVQLLSDEFKPVQKAMHLWLQQWLTKNNWRNWIKNNIDVRRISKTDKPKKAGRTVRGLHRWHKTMIDFIDQIHELENLVVSMNNSQNMC